jgi:hypothetical protein
LALVATLSGCTSRVNFEKTVSLTTGNIMAYSIDAPRGEQKVRIQIDSTEPINVDVGFEADGADIHKALERDQRPTGLIASKVGAKQDELDATIPAGKAFTVYLSGARKKAEVKLSVKSL